MISSLIEQLKRDEGTILHAYKDSRGFWTVGTGICIDSRVWCGITDAENELLLGNRIAIATALLQTRHRWTTQLDPVRLGVLQNMEFNLGAAGLDEFVKFLDYMQAEKWPQAAGEMLDSVWAKQVPERAGRLAKQIILGVWQ
jgi:lysozyme